MLEHLQAEAATRAADDLGFETILIHDACATIMSTVEYLDAEKE